MRCEENAYLENLVFIGEGQIVLTSVPAADLLAGDWADFAFGRTPDINPRIPTFDQPRPACNQAMLETVILGEAYEHPSGAFVLPMEGSAQPVFGGYRLEKILAAGAMGRVYLGRNSTSDHVAAIKTITMPLESKVGDSREFKSALCGEAQTARRLKHPAIVNIFDIGEDRGFVYITMELMPDGDLTPFVIPGNLLALSRVLSIIAQVAEALSYVHASGIVHRDIKPANIMRGQGGSVKLSDFGIARIVGDRSSTVAGTPAYLSPEQLCGRQLDGRSDLFSLGVTLYQLLCGNLPFHGDTLAQLMYKIANEPHASIHSTNPSLPLSLAEIIDRALAKQPQNRYQSGEDMARALRLCLRDVVSHGNPGSAGIVRGEE
jgi:serine/threonine-protein kinase